MIDPYKVLNIPRTASDREIHTAYRELVKKYHPDRYVGNPLADLADEKMKEINEAYDLVNKQRAGKIFPQTDPCPEKQAESSAAPQKIYHQVIIDRNHPEEAAAGINAYADYDGVRRLINQKKSRDAERVLDQAIKKDQNAEWYFLKAFLFQQRGFLEKAYRYYCEAVKLNPRHPEYRKFYEYAVRQRNPADLRQGQNQTSENRFWDAVSGILGSIFDICFH